MKYCLYGTVYNNVEYVEDSVKSFFSPLYDKIVIVDSFSTDGTYEKLKELEKDYNLTILRLKSSRGKGRDYALRHCPEGSFTAYVDLDVTYNKNLEKAITLEIDKASFGTRMQFTITSFRDTIIKYGGWKDLLIGEDVELLTRLGIKIYVPILLGINRPFNGIREDKYGISFISKARRKFIALIDGYRAAWNFEAKAEKSLPIKALAFLIATAKGRIVNCKKICNSLCTDYLFLSNLNDPADLGFEKNDVVFFLFSKEANKIRKNLGIDPYEVVPSKIHYLKRVDYLYGNVLSVWYYSSTTPDIVRRFFNIK
ncbi:glycosyltransferase family 2 protein [Acidianus sp. RZ1]|uniref:glycosyltransferase n=1 Tax=Acidianus sp. RZ1 TaxID=1540082 RepID=UPI0014931339|nr:glycosyltransferase [Acidianus sp. RZ1]NON61552.1 glycosyltransferase [Acidianus sp. RZ1]